MGLIRQQIRGGKGGNGCGSPRGRRWRARGGSGRTGGSRSTRRSRRPWSKRRGRWRRLQVTPARAGCRRERRRRAPSRGKLLAPRGGSGARHRRRRGDGSLNVSSGSRERVSEGEKGISDLGLTEGARGILIQRRETAGRRGMAAPWLSGHGRCSTPGRNGCSIHHNVTRL